MWFGFVGIYLGQWKDAYNEAMVDRRHFLLLFGAQTTMEVDVPWKGTSQECSSLIRRRVGGNSIEWIDCKWKPRWRSLWQCYGAW